MYCVFAGQLKPKENVFVSDKAVSINYNENCRDSSNYTQYISEYAYEKADLFSAFVLFSFLKN
jgi:hypothetical protein